MAIFTNYKLQKIVSRFKNIYGDYIIKNKMIDFELFITNTVMQYFSILQHNILSCDTKGNAINN